jgi:uncharacterized protein
MAESPGGDLMHYTLHVTSDCNLRCHYCYVHKLQKKRMTLDAAKTALDRGAKRGENIGIAFFGGEPLLEKQLIYDTVAYGREVETREGCHFHFKITTNGVLLDDEFLRWCSENRVMIALSIDGTCEAHDAHRRTAGGESSYDMVERAAKRLLKYQPYACAMMVVNPDTVHYYADGVQKLMDLGFQYYICSLNYEPGAGWMDKHMEELERQFARLADMYVNWTLEEKKFYFSPFEVKMRSHIDGEGYCRERCQLGIRQLSVDTDGGLYPCVQFVGEEQYRLGDVFTGVDEALRRRLFDLSESTSGACGGCAIKERCNHHCGCLNKQATGDITGISPVLCAHERLSLAAADRAAETLFAKGSRMFLQKQYNDMYPLISLIEDRSRGSGR